MRNGLTFAFASILFFGCQEAAFAQRIVLDWVEVDQNKIIIHYDLLDDDQSHSYRVHLFSSKDSFTNELLDVTGDGRTTVKPGTGKKIIWDITQEMGAFHGNLTFEIRATPFVSIIRTVSIDEGHTYRRAKTYSVTWVPGAANKRVTVELYKGNKRVSQDKNHFNTGVYAWHIPVTTKPAKDYSLRFVNVSDSTDTVRSHAFAIRRKIPLAVKAIVVAGAAAAIILGNGKSSPGNQHTTETKLPGPPDPP